MSIHLREDPAAFPAAELETARLVLRPLTANDAEPMALLAGDFAVASMTARLPFPYTRADAERFIADEAAAAESLTFAIGRRDGEAFIGCIGLGLDGKGEAEIGYWLGRPFWGEGLATEAARAVIDHAFEATRVAVVTGACRVTNEASRRVLEKCGLHYVSSGLTHAPARGGALPVDRFRLSRRDWESFKAWRPATVRGRLPVPPVGLDTCCG